VVMPSSWLPLAKRAPRRHRTVTRLGIAELVWPVVRALRRYTPICPGSVASGLPAPNFACLDIYTKASLMRASAADGQQDVMQELRQHGLASSIAKIGAQTI
jgi:hypothetical protein